MTRPASTSAAPSGRDNLSRAVLLLRRALTEGQGPERPRLVAFVQRGLGCGCPAEVIQTARLTAGARPLRDYLAREPHPQGRELLARRLNAHLGLPGDIPWPRGPQGSPLPPWRWSATEVAGLPPPLARLKGLSNARCAVLIDVPGRALFLLAVSGARPIPAARLAALHAAATLVKELAGYNRVRLFTLSVRPSPAPPAAAPLIDAALSWEAVLALLRESGAAQEAAGIAALLGLA